MRCLTLATALAARGAECVFLCRWHDGHLLDVIAQYGHTALALPERAEPETSEGAGDPAHVGWLGTSWEVDAQESLNALAGVFGNGQVDWLVVDHYALDARWEKMLRSACEHLMVIDDLADRSHDCDLLLDQNLGRAPEDYAGLIPAGATTLLGPQYALLRPEFAALRPESLARRAEPVLRRLLVTLGGVDKDDITTRVLDALDSAELPDDLTITVVMGPHAPWLTQVRDRASAMRLPTEVLVGVSDMARLMAESDLSIGAGGSTTWERCALGLPSIQVVLAANQVEITEAVVQAGAAVFGDVASLPTTVASIANLDGLSGRLTEMSHNAAAITDGHGAEKVARYFMEHAA